MKINLIGAVFLAAPLLAAPSAAQEPVAATAVPRQTSIDTETHAASPAPQTPAAKPDEISHEAMVEEQEKRDREEQAERDRDDQT
jgi:hypothetical protein